MSHTRFCFGPPFRVVMEVRGGGMRRTVACVRTYQHQAPAFEEGRRRHIALEQDAPPMPHYPARKARVMVLGVGEDGGEYILKHWHDVQL